MRDTSLLFDVPGPVGKARSKVVGLITGLMLAGILAAAIWQLGLTGHLDGSKWELLFAPAILGYILVGLLNSLLAGLLAGVLAAPFGLLVAVGIRSGSRWVARVLTWYVVTMRNLPLLVLIYFFFLFIPTLGLQLIPLWQLVLPLVLHNIAMLSDIFRSGMDGVPKGEVEAARALGLSNQQVTVKIIVPQAIAIVLPALITQYVRMFKETSLGFVVSFPELLTRGKVMAEFTHSLFETYLFIGLIYIVINYSLGRAARMIQEKNMARTSSRRRFLPRFLLRQ